MVTVRDYKDYTAGELANELERLQIMAAKKIPRFERQLTATATASEADRIIAEIKAIGNFDAAQVADINTAIRFSPFGGSSTATAQYIKDKVSEGSDLSTILDDLMKS